MAKEISTAVAAPAAAAISTALIGSLRMYAAVVSEACVALARACCEASDSLSRAAFASRWVDLMAVCADSAARSVIVCICSGSLFSNMWRFQGGWLRVWGLLLFVGSLGLGDATFVGSAG